MPDLMGLCSICGQPGEMHTCHVCGRMVCLRCYERKRGVCIECGFQGRRSNRPTNPIDG